MVDAEGPAGIPEARYIAGTTRTPVGEMRFIGVCIPYSFRWCAVRRAQAQPMGAPLSLPGCA